jgi:hypothetical protein
MTKASAIIESMSKAISGGGSSGLSQCYVGVMA